jgi:LuxR family transcriptional regulator, activator of conjugal transfer of Ti plasmids
MNRNRFFHELIEAIARASGEDSLALVLSQLRFAYGYDHFAYLNLHAEKVQAVSDYPEEWQAIYLARSYTIIDPVVTSAKRAMQPIEWSSDRERRRAEGKVKRFYDEAAGFGIRSGISIPVRTGRGRCAILTLASSRETEATRTATLDIASAASAVALLHAKIGQASVKSASQTNATLNSRETLCLKWVAEGKRMMDIALMEGLSYGTVVFHINSAKAKLDVYTLPHATAVATRLSLI